jgi:hypothetical protein
MSGSGPAPNPNSRRQAGNQSHTWVDLPAGGYAGKVPDWPLLAAKADALAERELTVWAEVWRTPQAAVWAHNGWTHDVALYVRYLVLGEVGSLDAAKEARMWSDRLGLNPTAMLKNRWRIARDEVTGRRKAKAPPARKLVVADGAVAGS